MPRFAPYHVPNRNRRNRRHLSTYGFRDSDFFFAQPGTPDSEESSPSPSPRDTVIQDSEPMDLLQSLSHPNPGPTIPRPSFDIPASTSNWPTFIPPQTFAPPAPTRQLRPPSPYANIHGSPRPQVAFQPRQEDEAYASPPPYAPR